VGILIFICIVHHRLLLFFATPTRGHSVGCGREQG
jgi:hypothetical protein